MVFLPPMPDGPPPPECEDTMKRLKWSVVAMILFGLGRGVFAVVDDKMNTDLFALINLFYSVVIGTFLFKEDEHLKGFYDCLVKSICQVCAETWSGGMQCLTPFMFCTGVNVVLDTITRYQLILGVMPYGAFLAGSLVSQAAAVYFSWQVFKVVRANMEGGAYEMYNPGGQGAGGFGGGYGGGFGGPPRSNPNDPEDRVPHQAFEDSRAAQTRQPQPCGGFVPFGGTGNRLGAEGP